MTILVKGMEMPENCANCPICVAMPLGDYVVYHKCALLNLLASKRRRRNDCPLIPIPPHGRLIDADAIPFVQSEDGWPDDYAYRYDINELPTVIEAEEG